MTFSYEVRANGRLVSRHACIEDAKRAKADFANTQAAVAGIEPDVRVVAAKDHNRAKLMAYGLAFAALLFIPSGVAQEIVPIPPGYEITAHDGNATIETVEAFNGSAAIVRGNGPVALLLANSTGATVTQWVFLSSGPDHASDIQTLSESFDHLALKVASLEQSLASVANATNGTATRGQIEDLSASVLQLKSDLNRARLASDEAATKASSMLAGFDDLEAKTQSAAEAGDDAESTAAMLWFPLLALAGAVGFLVYRSVKPASAPPETSSAVVSGRTSAPAKQHEAPCFQSSCLHPDCEDAHVALVTERNPPPPFKEANSA